MSDKQEKDLASAFVGDKYFRCYPVWDTYNNKQWVVTSCPVGTRDDTILGSYRNPTDAYAYFEDALNDEFKRHYKEHQTKMLAVFGGNVVDEGEFDIKKTDDIDERLKWVEDRVDVVSKNHRESLAASNNIDRNYGDRLDKLDTRLDTIGKRFNDFVEYCDRVCAEKNEVLIERNRIDELEERIPNDIHIDNNILDRIVFLEKVVLDKEFERYNNIPTNTGLNKRIDGLEEKLYGIQKHKTPPYPLPPPPPRPKT